MNAFYAAVAIFVVILPIKLLSWTCICGHTDEEENFDLERVFKNLMDCSACGTYDNYFYVPFYKKESEFISVFLSWENTPGKMRIPGRA